MASRHSAPFCTRDQLARAVATSSRTIDVWREKGIIPFIKVGGVVRFDIARVKRALESRFEVHEVHVPKKRAAQNPGAGERRKLTMSPAREMGRAGSREEAGPKTPERYELKRNYHLRRNKELRTMQILPPDRPAASPKREGEA